MKKSLLSLVFCLLSFAFMQAQSIQVSGKVSDGSNGDALPGVSVAVVGTTTGTITDIDGKFSLNVPSDATLAVSFIGYAMQQVTVAGQPSINIVLQPDLISLEEVVAVGYGVVKKKDITGSVSSVSSEELLKAPITSLDAGMQGKVAGVSIQNTSGAPGQKMKIRIRGGSSINYSNEPLYVIDGFIGADITTVNPSDIATIDILKDASATAVYGSRGANGVVLITTNAPKEGKMKVSFEANYGVSNMVNEYDLLGVGDMARLMNIQGQGASTPITYFSDDQIKDFESRGGTNWVDLVTRQGAKQNYTVNFTGGSEKIQYFFSANHLDEKGILEDSFYKRSSVRSNISAQITDWFDVKFNTYGTHTSVKNNGRQSNGTANTLGRAVVFPQVYPNKDVNGDYVNPTSLDGYGRFDTGLYEHPVVGNMDLGEELNDKIISNLDLKFDLGYNLSLLISNSGSFSTGFTGEFDQIDYVTVTNRNDIGATQKSRRGSSWLNTDMLTYDNDFGRHSLKVSAVYEYSKSQFRNNEIKVTELATLGNEWNLLANGVPNTASSTYNESKMRSYMGRVNYGFADKYLLTASMRADASSKFNKDSRWGYFPSAALAWRASEEPFIKDIDWIYNLKVRAGYGSTGNTAISAYDVLPIMDNSSAADNYMWYVFNNASPVSGVIPGKLTDPEIHWETSTQLNLGVDFAVLNGKLSGTFDIYNKKGSDIIIAKTIPNYIGALGSSVTSNFADIDNRGVEFALNGVIMDKGDFKWNAGFNISHNKNEVKSLSGEDDFVFVADEQALGIWLGGSNKKFIVQEGQPMGSLYGIKSVGIWQQDEAAEAATYDAHPGEIKYEDVINVDTDGDGIADATDGAINDGDRQIVGDTNPDFTYGINTSVEYKGFDLAIQCVGSHGNDIFNYSRNLLDRNILNPDFLDRWSPSNTGSSQPIMALGAESDRKYVSSHYIEDGSFFKISNVTIGYELPKNVCNAIKLAHVRLFVSGTNLLTITNYSGLDPEGSSTSVSSDAQAGIDAFSYPLLRTFTGGIKVTF